MAVIKSARHNHELIVEGYRFGDMAQVPRLWWLGRTEASGWRLNVSPTPSRSVVALRRAVLPSEFVSVLTLLLQRDGPQEGSMAPLGKSHNIKVDKNKLTVNNDSNYSYCIAIADIGVR